MCVRYIRLAAMRRTHTHTQSKSISIRTLLFYTRAAGLCVDQRRRWHCLPNTTLCVCSLWSVRHHDNMIVVGLTCTLMLPYKQCQRDCFVVRWLVCEFKSSIHTEQTLTHTHTASHPLRAPSAPPLAITLIWATSYTVCCLPFNTGEMYASKERLTHISHVFIPSWWCDTTKNNKKHLKPLGDFWR